MSESKSARWAIAILLGAALGVGAAPAFAQDEPEQDAGSSRFETIEEITVTARKREESLEDTPLSVVALSAEDLEANNVSDLTDLSQIVANLDFSQGNNTLSNNATIFIRGIGQDATQLTNDLGVGAYVDGVYLARMRGSVSRLADVERVEVLRGPQGTLFGRNTTGGAVNLITKKPQDELDARVQVTLGNYGRLESQAVLNVPLIAERLFARFSVATADTDGYTKNRITEEQRQINLNNVRNYYQGGFPDDLEIGHSGRMNDEGFQGARASLLWLPNESMEFRLTGEVVRYDQKTRLPECVPVNPNALLARSVPGYFAACAADFADDEFENSVDTPPIDETDIWTTNLHFTWDLGWGELKSITSRREMDYQSATEVDYTWFGMLQAHGDFDHEAFSQELQLSGSLMEDRIQYIGGLYWYEEENNSMGINKSWDLRARIPRVLTFVPVSGVTGNNRTANALTYAAFGQFTYNVNERLSFTAGTRRSHDSKDFRQANLGAAQLNSELLPTIEHERSGRWGAWTPMANLAYQLNDEVMAYLTWSKGFRSGGYNGRPQARLLVSSMQPFNPEKVSSWEAGMKGTFLDRRLSVNLAVFNMDYTDMQMTSFLADSLGRFTSVVDNAGESTIRGLEIEVAAIPFSGLRLQGGFGLTDAEFDEFLVQSNRGQVLDHSGRDLRRAPRYTYNLSAEYAFPLPAESGDLSLRLTYSHRDDFFIDVPNTLQLEQSSYGLVNGRITYGLPDGKTTLAVWGKNLADERYIVGGINGTAFHGTVGRYYAEPRMYGLTVTRSFF